MSAHSYILAGATGTEWSRNAVVIRSDGARFELRRVIGRIGPDVRRVCLDQFSGETVRLQLQPYEVEWSVVVATAGRCLRLPGPEIDGIDAIDIVGPKSIQQPPLT